MKKIAKLSLVAAVAVAGLTTANAQPLEEAIKNVDVSGSVVYRYNDYSDDTNLPSGLETTVKGSDKTGTNNYYKAVANLKAGITDDVALNTSVSANNNYAAFDTSTSGDANVAVELTKVNFAYTGVKDTTVLAGKMGVPTPWTVASQIDGNEQTGTGAVVINSSTPVTFIGAYFNQTNFGKTTVKSAGNHSLTTAKVTDTTGYTANAVTANADKIAVGKDANSIAVVGAKTSFTGVDLEAYYADQVDTLESYTAAADYKIALDGVTLGTGIRYTNLQLDALTTDDELTKGYISAVAGIFDAKVTYGVTGKDGGLVAYDNDAGTAMLGWNTYLNGQIDADYLQLHAGVQVLPKLNIALNHYEVNGNTVDDDAKEIFTQITYAHSKNLSTYVRLGQYETANNDATDAGRLQVAYKF
ncbi:MAG: major outer membrane protein [Aliarcobacter sp.]|nr:major outer membrane protein [Aliarcobacter sp.]